MIRSFTIAAITLVAALLDPPAASAQNPGTPDLGNWRGPCYNCYNYALNRKDWFFAQTHGVVAPAKLTCANTKAAAIVDGLAPAAWAGPPALQPAGWPAGACPPGHSLVALAVIPCAVIEAIREIPGNKFAKPDNTHFVGDFHWYRLNGAGTAANPWAWSHKRGQSPATDRDAKGRVMGAALPPHLADLGYYTFCCYMCVPNAPAALGPVDGSAPWTGAQLTKAWRQRGAGLEDIEQDINDLTQTLQHMPTLQPVPDPQWDESADERGIGLMLPPQPTLPPFMRVRDGVVAIYSDLAGDQFTQIQYFADDRGLEEFLKIQFDQPEVGVYGLPCDSSLGPLVHTVIGGDGRIGGVIDYQVWPYDPIFPGVIHLGTQRLDISLDIIGATGCTLLVDPLLVLPLQPILGLPGGQFGVPIPPDPALRGIELATQGLVLDPLVAPGFAASNGVVVELR